MHRLFLPELPPAGGTVEIAGEEARHAIRVKRLEPGAPLCLFDGRGGVARARAAGSSKTRGEWVLSVAVLEVRRVPAMAPRIEIVSASPKGERLERMIDGLSQLGVARWSPLECDRAVVEPGPNKLDRVSRVAIESSKQCGRAWLMEVGSAMRFDQALAASAARVQIADADGGSWTADPGPCRILIGPEGGWSEAELNRADAAGVRRVRLGPHVLRTETAALAAAALALHASRESRSAEAGDA